MASLLKEMDAGCTISAVSDPDENTEVHQHVKRASDSPPATGDELLSADALKKLEALEARQDEAEREQK